MHRNFSTALSCLAVYCVVLILLQFWTPLYNAFEAHLVVASFVVKYNMFNFAHRPEIIAL